VCPECLLAGPLLDEYKTQWILGVLVNCVRNTARLCPRATHVFKAQSKCFGEVTLFRNDASKYEDHCPSFDSVGCILPQFARDASERTAANVPAVLLVGLSRLVSELVHCFRDEAGGLRMARQKVWLCPCAL
jgi:hypothetical protein